jgi:hypothetical protein
MCGRADATPTGRSHGRAFFSVTCMWFVVSSTPSAINGAKPMARDDFIALCSGFLMCTGGFGCGWFITPEPAELKLAKIRAGLDLSIPIRTRPPDIKIIDCVLMWVGGPGGEPEIRCPPVRREERPPPAIPTS